MFGSKCRRHTLFQFKDSLEKKNCSVFTCSKCKVNYYRKAFVHFYTRVAEHMGISNLAGKHLKNIKQSSISHYLLQCSCAINFDVFDILTSDSNKFKLLLTEGLLIKCNILNRAIKFLLGHFLSIGIHWWRCQIFSTITWLSDFLLIHNSNFTAWTDRAKICFDILRCYIF